MSSPLNLIVLASDEMRGDCPSFMGNPDCQTPCLDRFAEKAVVLDRHFTVHGKCVPSRVAMITGRYCHTDGIRSVTPEDLIPADTPSLLTALKARGYETALFGVDHIWKRFFGNNEKGTGVTDYHSFTHGEFRAILDRQHPVQQPGPASAPIRITPDNINLRVYRHTKPLTFFGDDNRAEQAIHYLTSVRDRSRPFYLQVNFGAPHPDYGVEEPYFSMYDRRKITPFPSQLPKNAPLHLIKQREFRTLGANEEDFRQVQAVYYGMVTKLDVLIGRVLTAIEQQGLLENTIILFWVDHGDFAGQYGLPEKWDTAMEDCIMHVPQIVYAPGLPQGRRIATLTEHVDIAPTVLDLMGITPDWGVHGESLLPMIAGTKRKTAVFGDGGHEEEMHRRFNCPLRFKNQGGEEAPHTLGKQDTYFYCPQSMARTKMVRTDKWKLVIRLAGGNELYDMENDPYELDNLYGRPELAPVVLDLQTRMIEWCLRTDTDRPYLPMVGA